MTDSAEAKPRESWSYTGEVWTDGNGRATVVLPPFVRAHRDGFDYELMPVGSACRATVAEQIEDDRFTISTDQPHTKVAWRVTPLREERSPDGAVS